jgi:hypothetical protein
VAAALASQADLDGAQANYDSSVAAVNQARASLASAETDLRNSKITAPIDGVIVDRQYDVGQPVAASFQAPTIFTIAQDLTKMQVSADVSESDIGMIKVGQPVRFTVDAYPDQQFRGKIAQIRLNATVNQNVVTYPVIIEVNNEDLSLRPSMTANVSIDVATARTCCACRTPRCAGAPRRRRARRRPPSGLLGSRRLARRWSGRRWRAAGERRPRRRRPRRPRGARAAQRPDRLHAPEDPRGRAGRRADQDGHHRRALHPGRVG